ncbi:MAG: hypothetical protein GX038_02955 [Erysipelothrix sp.]|nr:hypothetical protein [Erysipelothrix sp.]
MKETFGIAFAGGGAKSLTQIAFIEWLQKNKIQIDYVSGTSAGALMASLFAMGLTSEQIKEEVSEALKMIDSHKYMNLSGLNVLFSNVKHGIVDASWLEDIIDNICKKYKIHHISDVKTPLAITSVDLYTGELIVFVSHPSLYTSTHRRTKVISDITLARAVRASMSFPLVFGSLEYENMALIDGGVRMNCPLPMLKDYGADKTISVTMRGKIDSDANIIKKMEVMSRVYEVMSREAEYRYAEDADYHLNVPLPSIELFDTQASDQMYKYGKKTVMEHEERLNEFFKRKSIIKRFLDNLGK